MEFTADASHELRTPLSVIEAHTSLALAQERSPEWYRNAFGRIDRESQRMRAPPRRPALAGPLRRHRGPAPRRAGRPGGARRADRRSVRDRRAAAPPRPDRGGVARQQRDHRAAGMARPPARHAARQRLQVLAGRRRRPRHRRAPTARASGSPSTTPGPASRTRSATRIFDRFHRATNCRNERGRRGGTGPRDRRLDRARHERPLADRHVAARRRLDVRDLAACAAESRRARRSPGARSRPDDRATARSRRQPSRRTTGWARIRLIRPGSKPAVSESRPGDLVDRRVRRTRAPEPSASSVRRG